MIWVWGRQLTVCHIFVDMCTFSYRPQSTMNHNRNARRSLTFHFSNPLAGMDDEIPKKFQQCSKHIHDMISISNPLSSIGIAVIRHLQGKATSVPLSQSCICLMSPLQSWLGLYPVSLLFLKNYMSYPNHGKRRPSHMPTQIDLPVQKPLSK